MLLCSLDVPSCMHCMYMCGCCVLLQGARGKYMYCTLDCFPHRLLISLI